MLDKLHKETIRLTAEGVWFQGGEEITHARTVALFFRSIARHNGKFVLTGDKNPVPVIVEDTAYFVRSLSRDGDGWELTLSDGSREELDPATLDVGVENQLYCRIKSGRYSARFDRKVYYELMKSLEKRDGFYGLRRGDLFYPLGWERPDSAVSRPVVSAVPARKFATVSGKNTARTVTRKKSPPSRQTKSSKRAVAKMTVKRSRKNLSNKSGKNKRR